MPKLTELYADLATVTVPLGSSVLRVTYRPNVVTPKFQKAVAAAQAANDIDGFLCRPLAEMIDGWDLTDDEGAPIPTTAEGMANLPAPLLLAILQAITGDIAPNGMRGDDSSNGSSPRGSATAPSGTSS